MQRGGRAWQFRIEDILEALSKIAHYVAGMDYEAFRADEKTAVALHPSTRIDSPSDNLYNTHNPSF